MALRKAAAYSKKKVRPYTRKSSTRKKAYIKAIPQNKIVKFNMGNSSLNHAENFTHIVSLVSEEKVQIRDNALESCRMAINKMLERAIPGNFLFIVKVYPHHILRENKIAAGAGADRLSSGMRHSFGITSGRAAIVRAGTQVFTVACVDESSARTAKNVLYRIKSKVPCRNRIVFEKVE